MTSAGTDGPAAQPQSDSFASSGQGSEDEAAEPEAGWQRDKEVTACPLCSAEFTKTFRRHHCRQCGRIVCDSCSKQRMRLDALGPERVEAGTLASRIERSASRLDALGFGKVRVCDRCVSSASESRADGFEEDVAANDEVIATLRAALGRSSQECDTFRRVLLELDAEASGDQALLGVLLRDPAKVLRDADAFPLLQERAQATWDGLLKTRHENARTLRDLLATRQEGARRNTGERVRESDYRERALILEAQVSEVTGFREERDALGKRETELGEAVVKARRRCLELERERRQQQERQARRSGSWGVGRHTPGRDEGAATPPHMDLINISSGRRDPLIAGVADRRNTSSFSSFTSSVSSHVESCRRGTCSMM